MQLPPPAPGLSHGIPLEPSNASTDACSAVRPESPLLFLIATPPGGTGAGVHSGMSASSTRQSPTSNVHEPLIDPSASHARSPSTHDSSFAGFGSRSNGSAGRIVELESRLEARHAVGLRATAAVDEPVQFGIFVRARDRANTHGQQQCGE
jgi:hypothetical protein